MAKIPPTITDAGIARNTQNTRPETGLPSQEQSKTSTFSTKPTLDELLSRLDLDRATLSSISLKKWSLRNHPDKNGGTPESEAKFKELTPMVEMLRIFLSSNELSKYHKDKDFQTNVSNLMDKSKFSFSNDDLKFLLTKSISIIQEDAFSLNAAEAAVQSNEAKREFYQACAGMAGLLHEAFDNKSLTFKEAINLASRTASLMADPSEHKEFLAAARSYKHLMNGKLWAQVQVVVGMAIEWLRIAPESTWRKQGETKLGHIKNIESLAKAAAATQQTEPTAPDVFSKFFSNMSTSFNSFLGKKEKTAATPTAGTEPAPSNEEPTVNVEKGNVSQLRAAIKEHTTTAEKEINELPNVTPATKRSLLEKLSDIGNYIYRAIFPVKTTELDSTTSGLHQTEEPSEEFDADESFSPMHQNGQFWYDNDLLGIKEPAPVHHVTPPIHELSSEMLELSKIFEAQMQFRKENPILANLDELRRAQLSTPQMENPASFNDLHDEIPRESEEEIARGVLELFETLAKAKPKIEEPAPKEKTPASSRFKEAVHTVIATQKTTLEDLDALKNPGIMDAFKKRVQQVKPDDETGDKPKPQ